MMVVGLVRLRGTSLARGPCWLQTLLLLLLLLGGLLPSVPGGWHRWRPIRPLTPLQWLPLLLSCPLLLLLLLPGPPVNRVWVHGVGEAQWQLGGAEAEAL